VSLDRWKSDIEYELKQINKALEDAGQALQELETKKMIVDEACMDIKQENGYDEGYLFDLQASLQKKIFDKQGEIIKLKSNPKIEQLKKLLEKINHRITIE
jgi:DNA integrity scanning protein DisA with diadenylate cyclase activity